MALAGVPFEDYPGLDLRSAANESGGALDMLNVEVDAPGRLRTRDGFTKFSASAGTDPYWHLSGPALGGGATFFGYVSATNKVQAIDGTSGVLGTLSGATSVTIGPLVNFASPSANVVYGATGTANNTILKYSGGSFSNVTTGLGASTNAIYANVTPVDNRLMLLGVSGLSNTDAASTVVFSNPGAPETFVATNFVQLSPGDGEQIKGVCNFNNQIFVFKQTRFFVFTGTTSDASGNPIFNFRAVPTGPGVVINAQTLPCVAAPDGVYFIAYDGVYRSTGGAPVKVSSAVDPLFGVGPVPPYFQGVTPVLTAGAGLNAPMMCVFKNRIYITYSGTSTRAMLIYDIPTGQWMYSNVSANGMLANIRDNKLFFAYAGLASPTSTNDVGAIVSTATTDAGTNITGRYRTAFFTFDYRGRTPTRAIAGVEKIVRETIVDGSGTVSYTLGNNWALPANLPTPRTLVLGTSPQVAQARDRTAVKGRAFSMQFSGTAPWTIERTVMNVHGYQGTGLKET